jgi:TonB-dependent receptor
MGQFGLQGEDVLVHPDQNNPSKAYLNSPTIDPAAILAFTEQNLTGPFFVLDQTATRTNATLSDFQLSEKVAAAYVMGNFTLGALSLTPGLRYERTRLRVTGFQLQNGTTIIPVTRENEYGDWLPSVVARITPSHDTVFRLAYSRSLGRPEYSSLSPGGSIDTVNQTVSSGNPDLKPYRADNFDLTAEWYFARGGILSFGLFAKKIRNPIFIQSFTETNVTYNGVLYPTLTFSQPLNAAKGDIIGVEAQYQQQFSFLPALLSGLGIQLTGTLTDSNLRLPSGRSSTFPSQSRFLYGIELFYQKGPVEASVAYHNTGHALLSNGILEYQDQSNADLRRLDAKASFAVLENVQLFFEAQNLTDQPTRQYQGKHKDWIVQNERYGRTFYAGMSVKF